MSQHRILYPPAPRPSRSARGRNSQLTVAVAVVALGLSVLGAPRPVAAQGAASSAAAAAQPADVGSVDGIIKALYAAISGPKGAPRDFDRLRTLLADDARFIVTGQGPDGIGRLRTLDVDGYISLAGPGLVANGFFEREIGRTTEQFGRVTHLMSAYDSRNTLEDAKPFARGVNSIQLFNAGNRWYIVTIMWDSERPDNPIPARYLTPSR
jgi:hypothetical protein